ncbi:hypothetical protein RHSIM_Rhsim09G0134100 [Rhododendron simsii]|uniref:Uncharacterized protein n=1 Tax=Rhododendron simsii TaxID=118357 RepID=A0A834GEJ7_RHOSS|nr:hypothetical protein RHSIM_Rhsim09G0134100 [Rhododendron simsii]
MKAFLITAYLDLRSQNKIKKIEVHHLVEYHNHCERQRQTEGHEVRDFYHGVPRQPERQVSAVVRQPQTQRQDTSRCRPTTIAMAGSPTATAATMRQLAITSTDRPLLNATMQRLAITTTDRPLLNATMQYRDHCEKQTKGQWQDAGRRRSMTIAMSGTPTATAATMQRLAITSTDRPLLNATKQYHDHCERQTKGQWQDAGRRRSMTIAMSGTPTATATTMQQLAITTTDRPLLNATMQQLAITTTDRSLLNATMQYRDHCEKQTKGQSQDVGHRRSMTIAMSGTPTATAATMQQLAITTTDRPLLNATMQQLAITSTDRSLLNATMQYRDHCEKQTKGQSQDASRRRCMTIAMSGTPTATAATMQQLAITTTDRPLLNATMQYHDHCERQTKGHEIRHFHHGAQRQPQRQVVAVVRQSQRQR